MPVYGPSPSSYRTGGVVGPKPGSWPSRPVETAFVLGGGGNRGAVQVGMMRALVEREIQPDLLVGTSIGAINGSAFAGMPNLEGVYLAADLWRRIAADDVFPRRRFHGTWRFLEKRPSVFPMDGLRGIVSTNLRFDKLEEARVPLLIIATRLEDGQEEWFTTGPAIDAVMASAALPGLYPAVEIGGLHYFDGGVLDNVGISAAMAAGAKRVFVLMCGRIDSPAPSFKRPFEAMFAAFSLALGARVRRDLANVPADVDVVVFEHPGTTVFDRHDFSATDVLTDQGYQIVRDALDEYELVLRQRDGGVGRLRRTRPRRRPQGAPNADPRADELPPGPIS